MLPLPLALLRVLDLTRSVAGATATRLLADLGAEVILVETPAGGLREAEPALFDHLSRNKFACAIDLARPEGTGACLRLAAACDVVFTDAEGAPLAYEALAAARPDVVCVRVAAASDRPGVGVAAAAAALVALFQRRAEGRGAVVDVSFPRLAASLHSAEIPTAALGLETSSPDMAPSGVYSCAEGSLAVAVRSPAQAEALARLTGGAGLRDWLAKRSANEAAAAVLAAGVAAQPLADLEALLADPHLRAAGFFEPVAQAGRGVREMEGVPYRFSRTPAHVRLPPPARGEHTHAVLTEMAGLSVDEVAGLRASGVVAGRQGGAQ